jgi:coiled-coil domain-containing protein 55
MQQLKCCESYHAGLDHIQSIIGSCAEKIEDLARMNKKSVIKPLSSGINLSRKLKIVSTKQEDEEHHQELNFDPKTNKKQQNLIDNALEEDSEIFDYDQFLDKSKPKVVDDRRPKYMADLIKNARERKMIYESIKAKKLEGETSEQFVTEAYKKEKDRLLELDKSQKGVNQFYKSLYKQKTSRGPLILGDKSLATKLEFQPNEDFVEEDNEEDMLLIDSSVVVNESNEVVDKRQLLKGGLNVSQKIIKRQLEQDKDKEAKLEKERKERDMLKKQRHQEQVERNLVHVRRQREKMEADREKIKSVEKIEVFAIPEKIDAGKVMDAKARYLARKNAQKNNQPGSKT